MHVIITFITPSIPLFTTPMHTLVALAAPINTNMSWPPCPIQILLASPKSLPKIYRTVALADVTTWPLSRFFSQKYRYYMSRLFAHSPRSQYIPRFILPRLRHWYISRLLLQRQRPWYVTVSITASRPQYISPLLSQLPWPLRSTVHVPLLSVLNYLRLLPIHDDSLTFLSLPSRKGGSLQQPRRLNGSRILHNYPALPPPYPPPSLSYRSKSRILSQYPGPPYLPAYPSFTPFCVFIRSSAMPPTTRFPTFW